MDREITKIVIILLKFISEAAVLFVIRAFYIVHAYILYTLYTAVPSLSKLVCLGIKYRL